MIGELLREQLANARMASLINHAHLAYVPREPALQDEPGQGGLPRHRRVPVGDIFRTVQSPAQREWRDNEPEAQSGKHGLRERADIDHPTASVDRLQRLDRTPAEPELAVVIVLDDPCVVPLRPVQESEPALKRHRHAQRKLMRGRDIDQPGTSWDRVDHQALTVDGHAGHPRTEGLEEPPRWRGTRSFACPPVARVQRGTADQIDGLLGAVRHHNVVSGRLDSTRDPDVPGGRLAQPLMAGWVPVAGRRRRRAVHLLAHQPAPGLVGEELRVRHAYPEVEVRRCVEGDRERDRVPAGAPPQRARGPPRAAGTLHRPMPDVGPGADTGGHEPLTGEPVVGNGHGCTRDAEVTSKFPGWWQSIT